MHQYPIDGTQGMGFDATKAREALEEADCDLDAAIEWLLASCV
jgi:translation elongation factor EF-Ts